MTTPRSRVSKLVANTIILASVPFMVFSNESLASDLNKPVFEFQSKLAKQGNAKAQYFLAQMYEQGRGTEANPEQAKHWYEKAKLNGYEHQAQENSVY